MKIPTLKFKIFLWIYLNIVGLLVLAIAITFFRLAVLKTTFFPAKSAELMIQQESKEEQNKRKYEIAAAIGSAKDTLETPIDVYNIHRITYDVPPKRSDAKW